jgi:hypothetical protein
VQDLTTEVDVEMIAAADPPHRPIEIGERPLDETALDRPYAPTAFSLLELLGIELPATDLQDDVAVVRVEGPLATRSDWCWDGYDTVEERVREALARDDVRAVVLALDSPHSDGASSRVDRLG